MKQIQPDIIVRKTLGLALMLVGICLVIVQLSQGAAPANSAKQTTTASAQAVAGMPRLQNAKVETLAVSGSLAATLRKVLAKADKSEWVGYSVQRSTGKRNACCGNYDDYQDCGTCQLEKGYRSIEHANSTSQTTLLEGSGQLFVLLRLEDTKVLRIQVASENCTLDAGGLSFLWLTGVASGESLAWLKSLVQNLDFEGYGSPHPGEGALAAIALHADPAADQALESFVAPDQHEELRKRATFWMGATRGKTGLEILKRLAKTDASQEVRAQVAFAFYVNKEAGAIDEMIRLAHDDASTHVRGQALFWLAQTAGQRASAAISGAIANDPDTEVKTKAVFALSQLPKDEGIPKLILVAETNKNPEVRKQAMFWLGQSEDPRAIAFFEKVLSR
jgi:HEAT repeat protein